MSHEPIPVVCRQASDFLLPNHVTGYSCEACGRALQVSQQGVSLLSQSQISVVALCNPCAAPLMARQTGANLVLSESAVATLKRLGFDVLAR